MHQLTVTISLNLTWLSQQSSNDHTAQDHLSLSQMSCLNISMECRFIKKVGWDAKLVNQSYPWVEKQIVHRPKFSPYQRAFRDSLLDSGVSPFNGFTYDHLYGTKVGGTIFDRFGRRHTAAELLASGNHDKLTVLVCATVQKIVFDRKGTYNIPSRSRLYND